MALITFSTLVDRQPGNPDTPISRAQYDGSARRGFGHDKDFYALYDSNADGSWDTAFELSDTSGNSGRLATLAHDDTAADPITITATGRVGAATVGNLTDDITYDNSRGFGVSSPGRDDDGAHVLNSGEAIDFAVNAVGGQAQVLQKVSFVVQAGEGEGRYDGHRTGSPVSVYLDFDGSTLARVNGHWETNAAYALTNVHDGDAIIVDFVNHTITENGHLVANVPAAFWAAYQAAGAHNLTIGSGADDRRGFAVENLSLTTAAATAANHPAVIGDPTVHDVTEDVNPVAGNLVAAGTIAISDPDAGQSAFQTTVMGAQGNLGSLTLQASGAYTYSVANSAVQYLGASDSKVDTFTVTSLDGTQKQVSFTIHGANDVAVIGGVAAGAVTEDMNPTTLTATGALTVSDADQGQSSFAAQVGTAGGSGLGTFSLDAAGHWTYTADNTQTAIQQLGAGQTLTDSFTAVSSDGSASQVVTVTINGTNDVAVIGGVATGSVTEDANPATLTTIGALTVSDADQGQSSFAAQVGTAGNSGLGTFALDAAGNWTYTADNTQAAIQQLGAGQTLTDSFTAVSLDGSASQVVTVTINGTNDVAVIGGVSTGAVTEDANPATLSTTGALTVNDADQGQSSFAAQAGTAGSGGLGTFSLDAAGNWTYSADNTQIAIQQLGAGQTLTDSFTAVSSDGSANQVVTVTIHGVDDAPVTAPVTLAPIAEDSGARLITQGELLANATDVDGPSLSAVNLQIASGNGTLVDNGNGTWSYTPAANDDTSVSFSYQVDDGTLSTPGSAALDITPVNDAPVIAIAPTTTFTALDDPVLSNSQASGINDAGEIVGQADLDASHGRGWLYSGGVFTTVWAFNSQDTNARAINDSDVIVGSYSPVRSTPRYGFIDNGGVFTQVVSDSPYTSTNVNGINNAGVIVGDDYLHPGTRYSGFVNQGGTFTYLIAPGANNSLGDTYAVDINNNGDIVGTFNPNATNAAGYRGFLYHNGTYTTITDPLGVNGTYVQGLNDAGDVVGWYDDAAGKQHGFVDVGNVFTTIDNPLGVNGSVVTGINNVGQVVGYYLDGAHVNHAFVASLNSTMTAEDTPLTLTTISVSDVDAGNSSIQVALGVAHGALSLGAAAGLTVDGLGSGSVTLTGSQIDIDAALASGLTYTPSLNYNGTDTLTITANDLGNTGAGGPLSSTQLVNLTVTPVNDPAVISGTTAATVLESGTSFGDEFNTTAPTPANWDMIGGPQWANAGRLIDPSGTEPFNNELQWYVNPATPAGAALPDPFNVGGGNLTISAAPASIDNYYDHYNYSSGLITSYESHQQLYGYFEMRAQLPEGQGLLPAFWLLPADGSHAELDAMEVLGSDPTTLYTTVHSYSTGNLVSTGASTTVADMSADYHTYGVDWEPNTITWYFDGQQVFQTATPSDLNTPMYMIANVAVGGSWPGSPDGTTPFPANMNIDYIRSYSAPPPANTVTGTLTDTDVDNPANTFQAVSTATASDHGYGTFTMGASGTWAYTLDNANAAVQALNVGGTLTDTFTVHTADGTAQQVTVMIDGANDAAIIGTPTVAGVTEDTNVDQSGHLTATGTISVSDVDNASAFQTTVVPAQGDLGTLSLAADGSYTYSVADSAVQYLGAGDSKVDTFTVASADGTQKSVGFTIHGANDAPVLDPLSNGTQNFDQTNGLSLHATMAFSDVDLADIHSVTLQPQGNGYLGTGSALVTTDSTGTGNGVVTLSYTLTPAQYQAAGGNIPATQDYLATLTDNNGLTSTQTVSIPLAQIASSYFTPPDNPPVIAGPQTTAFVLDSNSHNLVALTGSFDFTDLDQLDHHSLSMEVQPVGFAPTALGTLNFSFAGGNDGSGSGAGTVNWTYTVDPSTWPGGVIHHEYLDVVVTDSAGAHASHTLDIDYEPGATTTSSSLSVSIGGTAQEGQTLSAQASGYHANAALTYQWQTSSDNGVTWSAIAGATASTYAVQESDENSVIRVMATDAVDSVNTFSAATASVVDAYPTNASVTISGLAKQGQTLDANLSVGTDSDLGTATFQWQVSTDNGTTWADIAGATGVHYTATESDENNLLRVSVVATDDTNQSISLVSAATAPVLDNVSTTIQGNTAQPAEGQILTANFIGDNDGNGSPNTFEWQSSSDNGTTWTDIAGATAQTYQVQETDEGHLLRVIGHGVEIGGDPVSVASAPTGAVVDAPLTVSATITGTAQEGQVLSANASTNDADAVISGYQWQSSADNGANWSNIVGATASTYTPVEADENHLIRVSVAAQDADGGGSATATSAATSSVIDVTSVALVTIGVGSGMAVQGTQSFSQFLAFGDSNIDSGYFFTHAISNNSTLQTQYNAAKAAGGGLPTSIGGTMNSQLLAADYGLTAIPVGEAGGTNYAASGATVIGALTNSLAPSVTSQIQTYLASTNGVADPNGLYLISGGGNDFKIAQTLSGQTAQFNYMISSANALTSALSQLQAAGAKYIVIDDGAGRNALISEFNTTLWAGLDAAGVHYLAADDSNLVRQITANPASFGITNTAQPPSGPFNAGNPYNPANGGADINPLPSSISKSWGLYATTMQSANAGQTYLWADDEHLTAAGQLAVANYTHNLIQNGVPTPGEVLTANPALVGETDNAATTTFAFQWQHSFDDGHTWSNILSATGKNYTVASADDGARLRVIATATDDTGYVITAVSPETYAVSDGAEAPSVSVPSSLSAAAGGSVTLPITVTAADADDVLGNVTSSGLPSDVTLTDTNNGALVVSNGSITLTQAELAGLTLHVGSTAATLSITADASEGGTTATSAVQHVALDVSTPLSVSNFVNLAAPGSLNGIGGASDITNAGIVVGQNETYDLGYIQGGDGWLYDSGTNVYTFVHIGNQNSVSDLNDYGVLAGFYSPNNSTPRYGFIENGVGQTVTTIDLTPNVSTDVEGINDSGDYVGSSYQHGGNTYSAFSVIGGNLTYFNPFGSTDAHANGINNAGDIVGTYGTHAFLEHNGVFTTIDMPGATQTAATDINNAGQIVGIYTDAGGHGHGYIETNGVFVTVDHPLGTSSTGVYGLNDAGQIAGNYYDASGSPKAYIATITNPVGAATDDVLVANPQGTTLIGGAGNDTFVFTAAPQTANTIADFTPGSDVIQASAFGFGGGLTHGAAPAVLTGTPASVTNPGPGGDFIFDNSDPNGGTLYWDANGGSGADATAVAVLHGVNALLPTDFHVV